jgi:GTP-binding protein Era
MTTSKTFRCSRVAILGRPNAGKSTLLNSLLEVELSATSPRPQTTRTNIKGIIQITETKKLKEGEQIDWVGQIVFVDTPGVNFKKGLLDRAMHMSVQEATQNVDCVIWMADARTFSKDLRDIEMKRPGSDKIAGWLENHLSQKPSNQDWILCLSKVDLVEKNDLLPLIQKSSELLPQFKTIIPISSKLGKSKPQSQIQNLIEFIKSRAPVANPEFEQSAWTDLTEKQMIQNFIREAIFRQSYEEVPYQCDSSIMRYIDADGHKKMPEVDATLWVSKASLKPILVGKNGTRVRDIGIATRDKYKAVTGEDLVLRLMVKVVEKWDSRPGNLAELGYLVGS